MKIWKLKILEKLKVHIWLSRWDCPMTNTLRASRGLSETEACSHCECHAETTLHLLRDCYKAQEVWVAFLKPEEQSQFFSVNLRPWIDNNIRKSQGDDSWPALFAIIYWTIWRARNSAIFDDQCQDKQTQVPMITRMNHEILQAFKEDEREHRNHTSHLNSQIPLEPRWWKLNTDSSVLGSQGKAGAGVPIRNHYGGWIGGFSSHVGVTDILTAELWEIRCGIKSATKMGCSNLHTETDSSEAIGVIVHRADPFYPLLNLMHDIHYRLRAPFCQRISHIFREGNKPADWLAKKGTCQDEKLVPWESPSSDISMLLVADSAGVGYPMGSQFLLSFCFFLLCIS